MVCVCGDTHSMSGRRQQGHVQILRSSKRSKSAPSSNILAKVEVGSIGFGQEVRVSRQIDERFASPLYCQQACTIRLVFIAAKRDRVALHNSHTKKARLLLVLDRRGAPSTTSASRKPIVSKATADTDIGSTVPPTPPAPPAHETAESEGPGRFKRLFLFILRNLNYLQKVGVVLGIGAGAVYFVLNLMVSSKLEGVEAKLQKLDAKAKRPGNKDLVEGGNVSSGALM